MPTVPGDGVPLSMPDALSVTPAGSLPTSAKVALATPPVTENAPALPTVKIVLVALVIARGVKENLSAVDGVEVPDRVVTVTSTEPAASAGLTATICEAESLRMDPALLPNSTVEAPERLVPLIVTVVPPDGGPAVTPSRVMVGGGMYVNAATSPEVPPGLTTVTFTMPVPGGLVTVICVAETIT